jgi:alkylation response protein AidB-like acyl-CoA dehydrogenase
MQNELYDTLDKMLSELDVPSIIRAANNHDLGDHGGSATDSGTGSDSIKSLWLRLHQSGFLDVMLPESAGGAGLGWSQAWQVLFAVGRHGLPMPVAQTIFARALLAELGQAQMTTAITLAPFVAHEVGVSMVAQQAVAVQLASHVLTQDHDTLYLLPVAQAEFVSLGGKGCFDGRLSWPSSLVNQSVVGCASPGLLAHAQALGLSVQIAGAADRVLEMTLQYANDRVQFGKPIGKFQAMQQQLAEMAQYVYGARMASQLGCQTNHWQPVLIAAQMAKTQTSGVAGPIAAIAHAVHAAIGVTHEYDLQLYTGRLYEWARFGGSQDYWAQQLGQSASTASNLLDFVREAVFQEGG